VASDAVSSQHHDEDIPGRPHGSVRKQLRQRQGRELGGNGGRTALEQGEHRRIDRRPHPRAFLMVKAEQRPDVGEPRGEAQLCRRVPTAEQAIAADSDPVIASSPTRSA
jgi:hypothetical protein